MDQYFCKYHPLAQLYDDSHAGDSICSECGLVVGSRIIDVANEWRSFDSSRVGVAENVAMESVALATLTSAPLGSDDGEEKRNYRCKRDKSVMLVALQEFQDMAERLQMPMGVVEYAMDVFRTLQDSKKITLRARDPVIAAIMFVACRNYKVSRTFKELRAASSAKRYEIIQAYRQILTILETGPCQVPASELINRICSRLGLNQMVVRLATVACDKCEENGVLPGCSFTTIAAVMIVVSAAEFAVVEGTAEVSEASGCSESALLTAKKTVENNEEFMATLGKEALSVNLDLSLC